MGQFKNRKPSITTCPVRAPVIVEFWPESRSATANKTDKIPVLATEIKIGLLNITVLLRASYKPKNELSLTAPLLKTAAPIINKSTLTKKAIIN